MKKIGKFAVIFLVIVQLALVVATVYEMGYEQGSGLYLSIERGMDDRFLADVIITLCVTTLLIVLLLMPCIILKYRSGEALFRITSVYLAFMPVVNTGSLVHLFSEQNLFQIKFDLEYTLAIFASYIRIVVPVMVLLYLFYRWDGFSLKRWHKVLLVLQVPLFGGVVLMPQLTESVWFWSFYLLIVVSFDWWEKVYEKNKTIGGKIMMWLVFIFMYLRGCSRMIDMLVKYITYG